MRFTVRVKRIFTVLMVLALISSSLGIGPARVSAAVVKAEHAGDLQTKSAGPDPAETKDWNETSTVTEMAYKAEGLYINAADHNGTALYTAPEGAGELQPVPAGHLRVHYQRADGNYADLGLWTWGDVASPSTDWPKGAVPFPARQTDAYGAYVDLPVKDGAKSVSFLVVNRVNGVKEMENGDKTFLIGTPQTNEVWIKEGSNLTTPYEPVSLPENTVRIHYSRADNNQSQYGLWLWDDVASPSEGWPKGATPFAPEHKDSYGAYVDIPLNENAKTISFIVMKPASGDKDGPAGNENKSFAFLDRYNQLWVKENDPNVYTSPFGETPVGLLSAEVLSAGKLVLGFTMTDGLDPAALKSAISVKDAEGTAIPVTAVTITGEGTLEVATGAFDLKKTPLSVTYAGTTVSASTGWRMLDEMYNYTGDDLGSRVPSGRSFGNAEAVGAEGKLCDCCGV